MTYLYKLANRLARFRTPLLVVAVMAAGCSQDDRAGFLSPHSNTSSPGLVISPDSAVVVVGQTVDLKASLPSDGGIAAAVTWSSSGGEIDDFGRFVGAEPGAYTIKATDSNGLWGSATVRVLASSPTLSLLATASKIVVDPGSFQLAPGKRVQFRAMTVLGDGTLAQVSVKWSATGGTISNGGRYTAGKVLGQYKVAAWTTNASATDTAEVTIGASLVTNTLVALSVSPKPVSMKVGGTQQFSVSALWSNGSTTLPAITWSATGGSIATAGLYTAGSATGTYRVIANGGLKADTSVVTLTAATTASGTCATPQAGWIWCDDFEQNRLASYFEYDSNGGDFARVAGVGNNGSTGMRGRWQPGETGAGNLKLAFGRTPSSTFRPVDAGTANYREIYWRMYVKNQAGWIGGAGDKLSRATIMAGSNWSQAMMAHVWGPGGTSNYLAIDPASGTDLAGNLKTTTYNDFPNLRWLGLAQSQTPMFDAAHVGRWYCVEAHAKLNTAGMSNGVFDLWIDNALEAQRTGMNWVGSYNAYGINAVFFENWWNAGSPVTQERYFDDIVVSTQRIGCAGAAQATTVTPTLSQLVVNPASTTLAPGATKQFTVGALWSDGSTTHPAITWSATGGTVTADGLYAAGSTTGTFRVIASGGGKADTAVTVIAAATATSVAVSSTSVQSGASVTVTFAGGIKTDDWIGVFVKGSLLDSELDYRYLNGSKTLPASPVASGSFSYPMPALAGTYELRLVRDDLNGVSRTVMATSATITVVAPVLAAPIVVSGSNEPGGFSRIAETGFSAVPSGTNGIAGTWANDAGATVQSDGTAPASASSVLQFKYAAGLQPGYGPGGDFFGWAGSVAASEAPEYSSIYESLWLEIVGSSFETQAWGVKLLGYWGVGQKYTWPDGVPNQIFSRIVGNGTTSAQTNWELQILGQNHIDWTKAQNRNLTKRVVAGHWQHYELVMTLNTVGSANGVLKVWLDGVLILEHYDVVYRTASNSSGFYGRDFHPIWGGAGGASKSRDDYVRLDHLYMSGQPK